MCKFQICQFTHVSDILYDIRWQYCPEICTHLNNYPCVHELQTKSICIFIRHDDFRLLRGRSLK